MGPGFSAMNGDVVTVRKAHGAAGIVVVCEHASAHIPAALNDLGLTGEDRWSHAVWDPGARAVAEGIATRLGAVLVCAEVSRLVYDCNRPPEAPDAMPERSERIIVPGNAGLSRAARQARVAQYYEPFRGALAGAIAECGKPAVVTVHSFTPIYHGTPRDVEIGILHDADARLADAMLALAPVDLDTRRNMPYGPDDGVTHTLKEHAIGAGLLNVMIEIRNDLIATPDQHDVMAARMAGWIGAALEHLGGGRDG